MYFIKFLEVYIVLIKSSLQLNIKSKCCTMYVLKIIVIKKIKMILDLPRVSFSPESGGSVNPRRAIDEMRTQGTIRLKK